MQELQARVATQEHNQRATQKKQYERLKESTRQRRQRATQGATQREAPRASDAERDAKERRQRETPKRDSGSHERDENMNETRRMIDALKRCLRARGMTYRALGRALGLSESSVKRLFAEGSFTLARLERVCGVLDMSVA